MWITSANSVELITNLDKIFTKINELKNDILYKESLFAWATLLSTQKHSSHQVIKLTLNLLDNTENKTNISESIWGFLLATKQWRRTCIEKFPAEYQLEKSKYFQKLTFNFIENFIVFHILSNNYVKENEINILKKILKRIIIEKLLSEQNNKKEDIESVFIGKIIKSFNETIDENETNTIIDFLSITNSFIDLFYKKDKESFMFCINSVFYFIGRKNYFDFNYFFNFLDIIFYKYIKNINLNELEIDEVIKFKQYQLENNIKYFCHDYLLENNFINLLRQIDEAPIDFKRKNFLDIIQIINLTIEILQCSEKEKIEKILQKYNQLSEKMVRLNSTGKAIMGIMAIIVGICVLGAMIVASHGAFLPFILGFAYFNFSFILGAILTLDNKKPLQNIFPAMVEVKKETIECKNSFFNKQNMDEKQGDGMVFFNPYTPSIS